MRILTSLSAVVVAAVTLMGCGSPAQYIMSTKDGAMIVSEGKPNLDDKSGMYTYQDAQGKKTSIPKAEVVQIMER